jgi:hypothetical protein
MRGAKFVQRCWWLLFPLIIGATTFAFLPPQWKPNLVSILGGLFEYSVMTKDLSFC